MPTPLNIIVPTFTYKDGEVLTLKKRGCVIRQGTKSYIELQIVDSAGNPISLTDSVTVTAQTAEVLTTLQTTAQMTWNDFDWEDWQQFNWTNWNELIWNATSSS